MFCVSGSYIYFCLLPLILPLRKTADKSSHIYLFFGISCRLLPAALAAGCWWWGVGRYLVTHHNFDELRVQRVAVSLSRAPRCPPGPIQRSQLFALPQAPAAGKQNCNNANPQAREQDLRTTSLREPKVTIVPASRSETICQAAVAQRIVGCALNPQLMLVKFTFPKR